MRRIEFNLLFAALLQLSLSCIALAENLVQITDVFYCVRLSDGKQHIVKKNSDGTTSAVKNAKAQNYVETQIASAKTRLARVKEIQKDLKNEDGFNAKTRKLINAFLILLNLPPQTIPDIATARDQLSLVKVGLQDRLKTTMTFLKNVKNCAKNKIPGLDNISFSVGTYYARGTLESRIGWLFRLPQAAKDQTFVSVCLLRKRVQDPDPSQQQKIVSTEFPFISGPFCLGNSLMPPDRNGCTGQDLQSKNALTAFLPALVISSGSQLGPDPGSDTIVNETARIVSLDWGFRMVLKSAAPGGDCTKLSDP